MGLAAATVSDSSQGVLERQFLRLASLLLSIGGVKEPTYLPPRSATYTPTPGATQQQLDAADAVIAAFAWDDAAALQAWESQQSRQSAVTAIDARSDEVGRVVRAALRLINASLNQIRQQLNLPTISWQQVRQQLAQMVANGQGDPEA